MDFNQGILENDFRFQRDLTSLKSKPANLAKMFQNLNIFVDSVVPELTLYTRR